MKEVFLEPVPIESFYWPILFAETEELTSKSTQLLLEEAPLKESPLLLIEAL
jgi:hypothetical protein